MEFLESFSQNVRLFPESVAIEDAERSLTYAALDELSGRVYRYLMEQGVAREDVVLVRLPRCVEYYGCVLGIWKAGAILLGMETDEPEEREKFIRKSGNPKLEIDATVLESIFRCVPLEGYRPRDLHDAAFFVYTSGSTGNPKGILHEYGSVELMLPTNVRNAAGEKMVERGHKVAVIAALNYLPAYFLFAWAISSGGSVCVVPYDTSKNPKAFLDFIAARGITTLFVTPTYVGLFKSFPPCLRRIIVAAEIIRNVFLENVEVYSMYGMSETGSMPTAFKIDKPYDNTPIGKSYGGMEVDVCQGELRVKNPYVRCYVNLPEESAETFRGGWIYTGDMARELSDGNLVVTGRKNEMVKIDGNRVEPGEIESALRKVLGIPWVCVKIFKDNEGRASICAYYTENLNLDYERVFSELSRYLPRYMLPNHLVHLDSVPRNANGKLDKLKLECPSREKSHVSRAAPITPEEKALCTAFKTVLELDYVGRDDDFFALGGSSITAMEAVVESGLVGLDVASVYRGRTASRIAALYLERTVTSAAASAIPAATSTIPAASSLTEYPLSPTQRYIWNFQQLAPESTMYNICTLFRLAESVDLEKISCALSQAILKHRAILTRFEKKPDGQVVQRIPSAADAAVSAQIAVPVEKVGEAELEKLRSTLVQPFDLLKDPLFRLRIFKTEKASYLLADIHHIVFDGTSIQVFFEDVERLYEGVAVQDDGYEGVLGRRLKIDGMPEFQKALDFCENKFGKREWELCPRVDNESDSLKEDIYISEFNLDKSVLQDFCRRNSIGLSAFFIGVTLKAMSIYNGGGNAMVNWIYRDRNDSTESRTVGALYSSLPVGVSADLNGMDLLREVESQVEWNIEHPYCQYSLHKVGYAPLDCLCLLYQGDIRGVAARSSKVKGRVDVVRNNPKNQNILDLEVLDVRGRFALLLDYDSGKYRKESMVKFLDIWKSMAKKMINEPC